MPGGAGPRRPEERLARAYAEALLRRWRRSGAPAAAVPAERLALFVAERVVLSHARTNRNVVYAREAPRLGVGEAELRAAEWAFLGAIRFELGHPMLLRPRDFGAAPPPTPGPAAHLPPTPKLTIRLPPWLAPASAEPTRRLTPEAREPKRARGDYDPFDHECETPARVSAFRLVGLGS